MEKIVFFIDDDEAFLYILERTAKKIKEISSVVTAKNGLEALEKLKLWQKESMTLPNVMFIDINMPVMDGFEFLDKFNKERELLEEFRAIVPVVMLTSSQHDGDRQKAMATGIVQRYVLKPAGSENTEIMLRDIIK